jgi:hypothetical protein
LPDAHAASTPSLPKCSKKVRVVKANYAGLMRARRFIVGNGGAALFWENFSLDHWARLNRRFILRDLLVLIDVPRD